MRKVDRKRRCYSGTSQYNLINPSFVDSEANMYHSNYFRWVFGLLTTFALASFASPQQPVTPTPLEPTPLEPKSLEPKLENPIEPQTRGPLHEAYAQPQDGQPAPGTPIPKQPPAPIPEEPPEQKPEAENAQWIPGYWAWDSARQDYLWVSGVYRVPPQGRTYVPGYWTETAEGWRWVPGFWSSQAQQEGPYTPQPPSTLDNGPSVPAPDDTSHYIPGTWIYRDARFVWPPGFWTAYQAHRLWVLDHYTL